MIGYNGSMSLRPPTRYTVDRLAEQGVGLLDYEIAAEKAASLGRAGALVEQTLLRLQRFEGDAPARAQLLKEAAHAVYAYFIQRELCGMRRHDDAIREYGIPREVLVRLGAR